MKQIFSSSYPQSDLNLLFQWMYFYLPVFYPAEIFLLFFVLSVRISPVSSAYNQPVSLFYSVPHSQS